MNFLEACDILEIDQGEIPNIYANPKLLKMQYTKLALKYHPDKSKDDTTALFQDICEAYEYLGTALNKGGIENSEAPPTYYSLFQYFVGTLDDAATSKYLEDTFYKILSVCEKQAIQVIDVAEESKFKIIFKILSKYRHVFHLSQEFYDTMEKKRIYWLEQNKLKHRTKSDPYSDFNMSYAWKEVVPEITEKQFMENRKKMNHPVYSDDDEPNKLVLKPTLNDLWENNVYKYTKNGKKLLIPLWHHELVYDIDGEEFAVKMNPRMPSTNFWLDEHNNLHQYCEFTISDLWDDVVAETAYNISFGKKNFVFYPCQLNMKTHQKWVWEKQGISKIQHEAIFDISRRSDVILHIHINNIA